MTQTMIPASEERELAAGEGELREGRVTARMGVLKYTNSTKRFYGGEGSKMKFANPLRTGEEKTGFDAFDAHQHTRFQVETILGKRAILSQQSPAFSRRFFPVIIFHACKLNVHCHH
jgi:hypothetical protein